MFASARRSTALALSVTLFMAGGFARADEWNIYRGVSPVDDSPKVHLSVESTIPHSNSIGLPTWATLYIRCQENKTDVIIAWDTFVDTDSIRVTTRIDERSAETTGWSMSSDFNATFRRQPIAWIRELLDASTLYARLTPYGSSSIEARFNITGLRERIGELAEACHWIP